MRRLGFRQQMWIPFVLSLVCLAAVATFGVVQNRASSLHERELTLSQAADFATGITQHYVDLATRGVMTAAEARAAALAELRGIRFGKDGYVAVIDPGMHSVVNPSKPETEGKYLGDYQDENGHYIYREMVTVAEHGNGGLVDYSTHRPGATEIVRKRSYVKAYRPWNLIFVTGAYLDDIDRAFARSAFVMVTFVLVTGLLLSGVVLLVNRVLMRMLGGAPEYAKAIVHATAAGDLTIRIEKRANDNDSLIAGIADMQMRLRAIIGRIQQGAGAISVAMEEAAAGNADLAQRTEEQAAALQETSATMSGLRDAIQRTAADAKSAASCAEDAFSTTRRGAHEVVAVATTMEHISESSNKIGDILSMIESISFQTNILALNAAVEAARAQEHGRGFAVVASEVRALAQRSSTASKDIESLIGQSDVHVTEGARLVDVANQCMTQILDTVDKVDKLVKNIAGECEMQGAGVAEISKALGQIDEVTQHNAALVEQSAAGAQLVHEKAQELVSSVSTFRLE